MNQEFFVERGIVLLTKKFIAAVVCVTGPIVGKCSLTAICISFNKSWWHIAPIVFAAFGSVMSRKPLTMRVSASQDVRATLVTRNSINQ